MTKSLLATYTIKEHISEAKYRLKLLVIFFVVATIIAYCYREDIYYVLLSPLVDNLSANQTHAHKIIYTGLPEAFFTYVRVSLFVASICTFPYFCFHLYRFLKPGLHPNERLIMAIAIAMSPLLFISGAIFLFVVVIPKAWMFFLSFENSMGPVPLMLEARLSEYITLVIQLVTAFGISFQLPVFFLILNVLGLVTSDWLKKNRRISVVISFILAAIFTPPDVLSQIALAIPLILLYEFSILICKILEKKKHR